MGSEHDGVICYLTLVQFNASDNGLIEDSHAILCKVGSLNLLLRSAEASLQLYAFRVAQDTNVSTRDSEAPS